MHVHHGSQWLVKLILSPLSLSLSLSEAERAEPPPPSEGHTWVDSELRDYRVEVEPKQLSSGQPET